MSQELFAIKGTKDILNEEVLKFDYIIKIAEKEFKNYGYKHIITPTFETTSLFKRSIGDGTDIVEKEMYTFEDMGGRSITLRPEGTASIVRAYLEHKIYGKENISKFYYFGPMFRQEKPQAGRYREFYQIGAETFGTNSPILDAETILLSYNILKKLKIEDFKININSVGCRNCRPHYKDKFKEFLKEKLNLLCDDCKIRYEKNPLRVLDCKNSVCKLETESAPLLTEHLCKDCLEHFEDLKKYLSIFKIDYVINPRLVRGLDYYTNTVFEIISDNLGAQSTILAGGRYNNLLNEIGGKDIPAFGFAAGVERISMLIKDFKISDNTPLVYLASTSNEMHIEALKFCKLLREADIYAEIDYSSKNLKAQFQRASKIKASYVAVFGDDEFKEGNITVKDMNTTNQKVISINNFLNILKGGQNFNVL